MSGSIFRSVLVTLMSVVLAAPIIQDVFHVLKPLPLVGAIEKPVLKKITWDGWWSGQFQDSMDIYAKMRTGLGPDIIRLSNQLDYSLFKKVHARDVVVGEKGYLYEYGYIKRYCGKERMSYADWAEKLTKLKKVQDTLSRLGIYVVTAQAGSKATFYPEYFPADCRCDHRPVNDHDILNHIADSLGLHYVDYNNWFLSMKGREEGHFFTKQGIHWSKYAAAMAADSMVKYLRYNAHLNLPDYHWVKGDPQYIAQVSDIDIFRGLNLMMPPDRDTFYYPYIWYEGYNPEKPKIIFIADSYMWTWASMDIHSNISKGWEFWYYNNDVHRDGLKMTRISQYDWESSLVKSKCVVLLFSEVNIGTFGWGFVENAYAHFYEPRVSQTKK